MLKDDSSPMKKIRKIKSLTKCFHFCSHLNFSVLFLIFFKYISTFRRIFINLIETIVLNSVALSLLSKQLIHFFVSFVL